MNKYVLYLGLFFLLISCNGKRSALDEFDSIISNSNRILIHFNENRYYNEKGHIKIISNLSQINELRELLQKSTKNENCNYYNGTMTFFSDTKEMGFLEFSSDAKCPAFYLHTQGQITQYRMTPYFGLFLEGIRQEPN